MAMAPVAYCLWQRFLRFDPDDPIWPNRDRFVLSAGHASMLLYSLLHLAGVKAVSKDLRDPWVALRTPGGTEAVSSTGQPVVPAHPEYRWTSGVETTSGAPGPGCRHQRRHGHGRALDGQPLQSARLRGPHRLRRVRLVRRRLYDGRGEPRGGPSLAGHLKLSRLCWIYDNNRITIEGHTAPGLFPTTWPPAFLGHGWKTSSGWATPTTWSCSTGRSARFRTPPIGRPW